MMTVNCEHCIHVRVKGEAPARLVYYCVVHDQRTRPWETCPRWERTPGSVDALDEMTRIAQETGQYDQEAK